MVQPSSRAGQRRKKVVVPENRVLQGQTYRDASRVVSAYTGLAEWGLRWQVLIHFKEEKRVKELRDAKTRDETVIDKSLTFAHSYFLKGKGPPKPGTGTKLQSLNLKSQPVYEGLEKNQ